MLKLYRASAGSGKTFTLAVEYIKLLIADQWAYRHILAVTFTNKATAEMKERILTTLYGLSEGLQSAEGYFQVIRQDREIQALHLSDDELRRRAGLALQNLSHDYSRFHIATIDSFFISVIKDLARELDLTANLNIDMNNEEVLSEAVDNIISSLTEGSPTLENLKDFIREKIDAESNWKIDAEVKEFGQNIFNEHYLTGSHLISQQLHDARFMAAYKRKLQSLRTEALKQLREAGDNFMQTCENHGYAADDFKQKTKGVWGFFSTLAEGSQLPTPNSYVLRCLDGADGWCKGNAALTGLVESQLLPLLRRTMELLPEAQRTVATVGAIRRHLNHLQLLGVISAQVDSQNTASGRFLLANSAHFLARMIDKSNVPFIYEKSGTRFEHIMIDEFQDTSALQWNNFLPLLSNSLDSGQTCLIVGDVKQSIYRFRNSDWQILNALTEEPALHGMIQERVLDYNRRSLGNVIDFNNKFFRQAVTALNDDYRQTHDGSDCEQLLRAYSDVEQKILDKAKGRGYVRIECFSRPEGDSEGEYSYEEATLQRLLHHIEGLTAQGIPQRCITILLRYNRHIPLISNYFAREAPHIKLISDEAYRLNASVSVNMIVWALKYLVNPADKFTLVLLINSYRRFARHEDTGEGRLLSQLLISETEALEAMLPQAFIAERGTLVFQPLKELVERLYTLFSLSGIEGQDSYLFYFHDQLAAYCDDHRTDISSFLTYWDETLSQKTITGCVDDGVRIMSIHKSKGLEFHTVIIPFCDWKTTGKPTELLWCTPQAAPYDELKLVPVNFNEETHQSIFSRQYEHEVLLNNVDNLNLLYVAFTRAVSNLFILTESPVKPKSRQQGDAAIKDVRQLISRAIPNYMSCQDDADLPGTIREHGTLVTTRQEKALADDNVLTRTPQQLPIRFHTTVALPEFRQSNKSKEFIAGNPDSIDSPQNAPRSYIDRGLLYHAIFQQINTLDDIDRAIEKMNMEGHFRTLDEKADISRHIHQAFSDPFAARWFTADWQVVNERAILLKDPATPTGWREYRADRVILSDKETIVIDYKTGQLRREHEDQVRTYMQLLTRMGYPDVKGYVWYIMTGKTYKVNQ